MVSFISLEPFWDWNVHKKGFPFDKLVAPREQALDYDIRTGETFGAEQTTDRKSYDDANLEAVTNRLVSGCVVNLNRS